MSPRVEGVLPYWLDRRDEEAIEIALEGGRRVLSAIGESVGQSDDLTIPRPDEVHL